MAKKAKAAKAAKKVTGGRPPADAMCEATAKEMSEESLKRGGELYGHMGRVLKALKGCSNHRGSCETVAKHLAKDPEHQSKTDALTLVRYFMPQLRDAGYVKIDWEAGQ